MSPALFSGLGSHTLLELFVFLGIQMSVEVFEKHLSMSASVKDITVDMLRHVLHDFVREETLTAASAEIVNRHHALPLSAVHGTGTLSSSDAQRFGMRASSLLASYYPPYYGYYEKAIGVYTHIPDQYAVDSTKVISCSPREALYVLDGLLANNTIPQIREHTLAGPSGDPRVGARLCAAVSD
jgi:TnpA family transposase